MGREKKIAQIHDRCAILPSGAAPTLPFLSLWQPATNRTQLPYTSMLPTEEVSHQHLYYLKCFLKCGWTFTTSHGLNRRWMGTPARNSVKSWPNTLFPQSYSDVHALTISRVLASASHMWLAIILSPEPDLSQFSTWGQSGDWLEPQSSG